MLADGTKLTGIVLTAVAAVSPKTAMMSSMTRALTFDSPTISNHIVTNLISSGAISVTVLGSSAGFGGASAFQNGAMTVNGCLRLGSGTTAEASIWIATPSLLAKASRVRTRAGVLVLAASNSSVHTKTNALGLAVLVLQMLFVVPLL